MNDVFSVYAKDKKPTYSSCLCLSLSPPAAKVGKTSLIMSLVSEEFPEVVRMNYSYVRHALQGYGKP